MIEERLTGGNVADAVVRIGSTVRKPVTAATPAVEALLTHLAGQPWAPASLGRDEQGRHRLEFIPGSLAADLPRMSLVELRRLGGMIREFHDAVATFVPPADAHWNRVFEPDRVDLICHNDLAPWNLIRDGDRWAFIDWDAAAPGSRLWDLGYAAQSFVPLIDGGDPVVDGPRLRALADGYRLDDEQRRVLPELISRRTRGMFELLRDSVATGSQPWARLYAEGHGEFWGAAADYVDANLDIWGEALCRPADLG